MSNVPYHIEVEVESDYIPEQSLPEERRYVFAYTITIRNQGTHAAQLISRRWLITDGDGRHQEVHGPGVVGEQPHLAPGESYRYTSGTVLDTPVGTMQGSYQMLADDGREFDAEIPVFTLAQPNTLH